MCWITIALGAHHGDLIAVRDERLALKPHPPIERHRKVLDDNQDARHQPCPLEPGVKSTSASVPPLTRSVMHMSARQAALIQQAHLQ